MGLKIQLCEVGAYRSDFLLWGWMTSEVYKEKMHVLFLSYDRNTESCICLSLHLLMYFIIISHKNHCTGMSSQVTECGYAVILSNGL